MARADSPLPDYERYSKQDLQRLLEKARSYVGLQSRSPLKYVEIDWLCREKSEEYFDEIKDEKGNIMNKYLKDNHGDPRNPINGRLHGLFFNPTMDYYTEEPPDVSPYGNIRLKVSASKLARKAPNLYFSDFYCITGSIHYVQLVMTSDGSEADRFCRQKLVAISATDRTENPFFFYTETTDGASGSMSEAAAAAAGGAGGGGADGPKCTSVCSASRTLWIELFYTEDVDLKDELPLSHVRRIGYRSGGDVGLRKRIFCEVCVL